MTSSKLLRREERNISSIAEDYCINDRVFLPDLEKQIKKNSGDTKLISKQLKKFQDQINKDQNKEKDPNEIQEIKKEGRSTKNFLKK